MRELMPLQMMAGYLRVKPKWLREQADLGLVPSIRTGDGSYLFSVAALERELLKRASTAEARAKEPA